MASLIVFLAGLLVWLACASYLHRPFVGDQVDDGQYLVGAQSLRDGHGYRLPSRVGSPVATKYPPGVSIVTSLALRLAPGEPTLTRDQQIARAFMFACAIVLAVGLRRLARLCGLDAWVATFLALALLFHPTVMMSSHSLNADLPFAALATWLTCRWAERWQRGTGLTLRASVVDALIVSAAMIVRGNGITLLIAGLVAFVVVARSVRDCWRPAVLYPAALYLTTVVVLVGTVKAWAGAQAGPRDTGNYGTELAAAYAAAPHVLHYPLTNAARVPGLVAGVVLPMTQWMTPIVRTLDRFDPLRWTLDAAVLALIAIGLLRMVRPHLGPAVLLQVALTLAVFCAWYYPIDMRFCLPIVPVVLIAFVLGVVTTLRRLIAGAAASRAASAVILAGGLIVLASVLVRAVHHDGARGEGPDPQFAEAFDAIRRLTPGDAVIICEVPELVYLNTGRQTAPIRDDTRVVAGLPPSWPSLTHWVEAAGGRPLYVFGPQPKAGASASLTGALVGEPPRGVATIFSSTQGALWLGQVSDVPQLANR